MAIAIMVSAGAGVSEEVAYRGVCYGIIDRVAGEVPALVLSSILFALAHDRSFGVDFFIKAALGLLFPFIYKLSGFNLLVPIVMHVVYDFLILFFTWQASSIDFKRRIDAMEWDIITVPADTPLPPQIENLANLVSIYLSIHLTTIHLTTIHLTTIYLTTIHPSNYYPSI